MWIFIGGLIATEKNSCNNNQDQLIHIRKLKKFFTADRF
jgi:hypothetical protein